MALQARGVACRCWALAIVAACVRSAHDDDENVVGLTTGIEPAAPKDGALPLLIMKSALAQAEARAEPPSSLKNSEKFSRPVA